MKSFLTKLKAWASQPSTIHGLGMTAAVTVAVVAHLNLLKETCLQALADDPNWPGRAPQSPVFPAVTAMATTCRTACVCFWR